MSTAISFKEKEKIKTEDTFISKLPKFFRSFSKDEKKRYTVIFFCIKKKSRFSKKASKVLQNLPDLTLNFESDILSIFCI